MKTNRILMGLLAFVIVVVLATSGYMLGFASGRTAQPAAPTVLSPTTTPGSASAAATSTPEQSAVSGATDAQVPAGTAPEFKTFWEAYNLLKKEYYGTDLATGKELEYNAIRGMIFGLSDQFTSFVSPASAKLMEEVSTGSFSGIGANVQLNKNRVLQITKIMPDSPAEKAGLKAGDLISEVDGKSIVGQDIDEQVSQVRGPDGSKVTLTVVREGEDKPLKVDVTRAKIEIKLVESKMLDNNVAYVALNSFNSATAAEQLQTALKDVLAKNPKGLVFDLRDNPGGFLDQSVKIADMFLKDGVVLYERSKNGDEQVFRSDDKGIAQDIPLVVLVNGGSASAAEIVSGAIQDRGRGVLIGSQTFGKGSVQEINHLADGSQLRITIAHWFTPNNHGIHGVGIAPDITVDRGTDPAKDPQLDRAVEYILNGK